MTESQLERTVVAFCNAHQLLAYKFTSPAQRGVPDRIILGRGKVLFLELKQMGKKPTKLQEWELKRINAAGVRAEWACSPDSAKALIREHFHLSAQPWE